MKGANTDGGCCASHADDDDDDDDDDEAIEVRPRSAQSSGTSGKPTEHIRPYLGNIVGGGQMLLV